MLTLIIGGSASGKSEYAEQLVLSRPGERIYLATMSAQDPESLKRIEKHRRARAGRGFTTVECPTALWNAPIPAGSNVLLEDLDNLFANETFSETGGGAEAAWEGILSVLSRCEDLTVVAGELFSGGADYYGETIRYLEALAALERKLAGRADRVAEVVCGLPCILKGSADLFR